MGDFDALKSKLQGSVVIVGIGNTLQCDDGAGVILASRIRSKVPFIVYEAGVSPENYLGKVIRDNPQTIVLFDAAQMGGDPGEFRVFEGPEVKTTNLFSTHNSSIALAIDYFQEHLKAVSIMALLIQPKRVGFGDTLSPEVEKTVSFLEQRFLEAVR